MKYPVKCNTILAAATVALCWSGAAQANIFGWQQVQRWDMCNWDEIPEHVLRKISRRDDFEDILNRMFDQCPQAALSFADRPTATVDGSDSAGDRINGPDGPDPVRGAGPTAGPASQPGAPGGTPAGPGPEAPGNPPGGPDPETPNDPPNDPDPEIPDNPPGDPDPDTPDEEEDFGLPG